MGCSPWGRKESDTTERLHFHFSLSCIGEGNGNPLQCSCLENPRDGGAWWAAVYGVAQSRTRLKRLSSSSSIYIYITSSLSLPPAHPHPTFVGHHRAAGWAPCITQQLLASYLFHIWSSMYVDVTFSIHPTLSFPHCVHKSILYICITVPSLHIGSLIPFF